MSLIGFILLVATAPLWYSVADFIAKLFLKVFGVEDKIAEWLK